MNRLVYEQKTTTKTTNKMTGTIIGCRIPKDYFITKGHGESDITVHAGSYHLALKAAGIEMCNIMQYSSILPSIAQEIERPEKLLHGQVMETIMAVANGKKWEKATAGIIYGWLYDRKTGEKYGGLVCEHNGNYDLKEVEKRLKASINELYANGFSEQYELKDMNMITDSFSITKENGTALVALCFTNYLVPIIG